jgi:hypothetical protein
MRLNPLGLPDPYGPRRDLFRRYVGIPEGAEWSCEVYPYDPLDMFVQWHFISELGTADPHL